MRASRRTWTDLSRVGPVWALGATLAAAAVGACGDDNTEDTTSSGGGTATSTAIATTTTSPSSSSTGVGGEGQGAQGQGGDGGTGDGGAGGGDGGAGGSPPVVLCDEIAEGATRGSAIAISKDDSTIVSVNRDVGTVTVTRVTYGDDGPAMEKVAELDVGEGSEPWQVAMNACGTRAYVVLRKDQKVVELLDLDTDDPSVGAEVEVGSEPTGIAISPFNSRLYVANWVEGTVDVITTETMQFENTIDLNPALVDTGYLGADATPRASLAHPRAIAITNNGNTSDTDETILVTEWFAQRTAPESADGKNSDINKTGLLYAIDVDTDVITAIELPPIADVGINNRAGVATGCFPNQVSSVTIKGSKAYVTSTCASPVGPVGVNTFNNAPPVCTVLTQETNCGFGGTCNATTLVCNPNVQDVKTTTHPALHVVDLDTATSAAGVALDAEFSDPAVGSARMPLLPTDLGFFNGFAYISAMGADAVFRVVLGDDGLVESVGGSNDFIDMRVDANDTLIRLPVGIATAHGEDAFAFVSNDGSRDVTAIAFNTQTIAGGVDDARILQASELPAAGTNADEALRGKRFFTTGLGRWSLAGAAWGSCAACHIDGLTDNVTWYFGRGPRQSTSLDGSFASNDASDQRIFNWTAVFDEVADFEGNTRGISGGLGAIVDVNNARINTATQTPPQQGLQGSSAEVADPNGESIHPHSVLNDWAEITAYVQAIRSPRRPVGILTQDIIDGREIFTDPDQGNCIGCHAGPKWTISTLFYAPGDVPNGATGVRTTDMLEGTIWNAALNGFPVDLLPATAAAIAAGNDRMRNGAAPAAEQIQCILRPVGTISNGKLGAEGVSPADVNVRELRQDMSTPGQGAADTGRGFNPPSLLGMQVGAPYFHAGNARTLEEVFDDIFQGHHQSDIAQAFVMTEDKKRQLVAFLLSLDEDTTSVAVPAKGGQGGDLCFAPVDPG